MMATIFIDGFDVDFPNDSAGFWSDFTENYASTGTLYYQNTTVRNGLGAIRIQNDANQNTAYRYISKSLPSTYTELYVGFAFRYSSSQSLTENMSANFIPFFGTRSSTSANQVGLGIDKTSRLVYAYFGNADNDSTYGYSATSLSVDTWYYIDFHVVISDTVGVVQVKIDGALEIDVSAADTNNGGGNIQTLEIGILNNYDVIYKGGGADFYYDDFAVNDTTGSVGNSWLNLAGVFPLHPDGDGNYAAWSSTGAADYTEVDDTGSFGTLPDDDTTMLSSSTTGARVSLTFDDLPFAGIVQAVQIMTYNNSTTAGTDEMANFVRIGTTDYDQTAFVPSTSWAWQIEILNTSPATATEWDSAEIDGMEVGFKRVT